MYAVFEFRTNAEGVMLTDVRFKTDNAAYAESKVYELETAAVTSNVYVHTILCVDEHGNPQFGTPKYFEHIQKPADE